MKVRAALVRGEDGRWVIYGSAWLSDEGMMRQARARLAADELGRGELIIEAEIPDTEIPVVKGEVK